MVTPLPFIAILGVPITVWFGMATFLCLVITATLGILVLKGRYNIPFAWHMRMAVLTIVFAAIHVMLVLLYYFF